MKNKIFGLYILFTFLFSAGIFAFADQPNSSPENKSVDTPVDAAGEKQAWLAQVKAKESKETVDKQAEEVYNQGIDLYKKQEFAEAKKKFEEVSWVVPDYKATMKYLADIDREVQQEQERIAREQQKLMQERQRQQEIQQKKQEMEQKKRDVQQQRLLEAKERQHTIDIQDQSQYLYRKAVALFDKKRMLEALDRFNKIEKLLPDFKSTRVYIARIQQWKSDQQNQQLDTQDEIQEEAEHQKELADEQKRAQELKEKTDQAQKIYTQALELYRNHQWSESKGQFESVEQILPDFKGTRRYLQKIGVFIAKDNAKKAPVVPSVEMTPQQAAVSLGDQQKQAQDIAALAEKSAQLYHQITDIADDNSTVQTKKKMSEVDGILNNLKENKQRLLRQMQEDQWKQQQKELKAKQEERKAQSEKTYQEALELLRSHDYTNAKIKFLELENITPNYRATRRYLVRIEADLKKANVEAVTNYEQNQAAHLKQLQDKENAVEMRHAQEEDEKQRHIEEQQQASLKELAQKASDINDDIIRLSQAQDYAAMKVKFAELENTVTALTTLKDEMAKQKDREERQKELAREAAQHRNEILNAQKREDQQIHAYSTEASKAYRPILSSQPTDADQYKRRDIMQEQDMLFSEGVDRYEHKQYTQAKLLFGELSDQHDRRAEVWLKKVDRAITRELLRSQEGEERERTAFIADQVRAQRELIIIQERERQRQKKLTEELESQKRLYEDSHLLELRKEETMKAQERERQRQEAKRLRAQEESEKQQQMLRFHKVEATVKPKPVPAAAPAAVAPKPVVPPPVVEQKQAAPQAKINAPEDARQKRIEERQKEREHQKELRAQREAERQARLKAEADAREKIKEEKQKEKQHQQELKEEQARAQAEKSAQEKQRRQEALRQQEQQREERMRQEEIVREETQHRQEMERQERERQSQLEAQREAVRKQLEDGVEAMYQDAMRLYQQGEYTAAAGRFKDVQDIIPGYKRAGQYMDEARLKSLSVKPPAPASPSPSHQDNVSKALDLFDPNAK